MIFGYTWLDPFVVILGTIGSAWIINRNPLRLVRILPVALSVYFFIPTFAYLTLWQTIPMLLTIRMFVRKKLIFPREIHLIIAALVACFLFSAAYGVFGGSDSSRALIRIVYYLGVFSLLSFGYEIGRSEQAILLLKKGFVILGVIYGSYGLYQIAADALGLPVRGILRGVYGADLAYEYGMVRINSLANEPKRLGYLLFISALACFTLVEQNNRSRKLKLLGVIVFGLSFLTFAGSYFITLVLFALFLSVLYAEKFLKFLLLFGCVVAVALVLFPEIGIYEAIQHGYERRYDEIEVGLDGARVYRQEFYAWELLRSEPSIWLTGLGLGQYFITLFSVYGEGVGYSRYGSLVPLNSTFLETLFDLGGVAVSLIYLSIFGLILKLRRAKETFLSMALLFLVLQSFTILTMLYIALFCGMAMGHLKR